MGDPLALVLALAGGLALGLVAVLVVVLALFQAAGQATQAVSDRDAAEDGEPPDLHTPFPL